MRIDICHEFCAAREDVEALYLLDDEFNRVAFERMGFARSVLALSRVGSLLVRTLRLTPLRALPAPFASLVSGAGFHIVEQVTYDFTLHAGTFRTVPSVLSQHFSAQGVTAIDGYENAAVFRLSGEASCTLPLVAKRAEKQAVITAEQQHAFLADEVRARLTERGRDGLIERSMAR